VVFGQNVEDWMTDGLVGHWKMDDDVSGDAQTIIDYSGNGHDGLTDDSDDTLDCTSVGKFNLACNFSGDNDTIEVTSSTDFQTQRPTVAAWIKSDNTAAFHQIVNYGVGGTNRGWRLITNGTSVMFGVRDGSTTYDAQSAFGTISQGEWHHVVGVYDGSTVKVYVDGELGTTTASFTGTIDYTSPPNLTVGGSETQSNDYDGAIDEVRVYNRALSSTEAEKLYKWAPGPVGYWKMDEGSGTRYDVSGYGNDVVETSGTVDTVRGKFGKAGDFEMDDTEYLEISDGSQTGLNPAASFSFGGWIKWESYNDWTYIITKENAGESEIGYAFYTRTGGSNNIRFTTSTDGTVGNAHGTFYSYIPTVGQWYHFFFVYDHENTDKIIYKNGVEVARDDWTGPTHASSKAFILGYNDQGGGTYFDGQLDEVKFYNYTRTQEQIIEDMNAGHPAPGSPIGSAVAHWDFDEGYGSTANDSGTGGNNGTLGAGDSSPAWTLSGKYGKALDFGPSYENKVVSAGDVSFVDGLTGMTASFWVNPSSLVTSRTFISKWNNSDQNNFVINTNAGSSDELRIQIADALDDISNHYNTSNFNLSTDAWTHIIVVYDGSVTASDRVKVYKNGVLKSGSIAGTMPTSLTSGSTTDLTIGQDDGNVWSPIYGVMDDVRIYNFALSESQVKVLYSGGASQVLGAISTDGTGPASWAASAAYCPPGDSNTCNPPIAEWNFDEKAGTSAYDTSENNNTGTTTSTAWHHAGACQNGACLEYNGAAYVNAGSSSTLDDLHQYAFTAEAWIKADSYGDSCGGGDDCGYFISKAASDFGWRFLVHETSGLVGRVDCLTINAEAHSGTDEFSVDGKWHHVAMSYDNSGTREISLYIDGGEVSSYAGATPIACSGVYEPEADPLIIGSNSAGDTDYNFDGKIDQVTIYDYVRTPAQIAWSYNKGGPIGWWQLDECSGTTAYDFGSLGNNGTITIGAYGDNTSAGTCGGGSSEAWANGSSGKFSSSLDFDNSDDLIDLGDNNDFTFIDADGTDMAFSVSAWIKSTEASGMIISKFDQDSTNREYILRMIAGKPSFRIYDPDLGSIGRNQTTPNTINDGNWHHILGTYDGSASNSGVDIYVDGVLVDDGDDDSGSYQSTLKLDGQIDDVKLFNYELTHEQVKQEYNSGATRFN